MPAQYEFVRPFACSTNYCFLARRPGDSTLWVGKLLRNSSAFIKGYADLNHRAVLAYRLALLVDTCVPETIEIDPGDIGFSPEMEEYLDRMKEPPILHEGLLLIRFSGVSLPSFLKISTLDRVVNLNQLLENMVFNLWIGNYDKKDSDYVVDNGFVGSSIDYSLSGPGFVDEVSLSIGAYFQTYDLDFHPDSGWAIADSLLRHLRVAAHGFDFFEPIVSRIEGLSEGEVAGVFQGLRFYRYGTTEPIDKLYFDFLIDRKSKIREAVRHWSDRFFPKSYRIPGH